MSGRTRQPDLSCNLHRWHDGVSPILARRLRMIIDTPAFPRPRCKALWSLAIVLSAYASMCQAVSLRLIGLAPHQAEFQIDGVAVRTLRPGTTSPEGIRLISASSNYAEVEVDGQIHKLSLGQRVEPGVELKADARGHFLTDVVINGRTTRALIDTGATTIALSQSEAERLGLPFRNGTVVGVKTASGEGKGYLVTLDYVQLGPIVLRQVPATVSMQQNSPAITLVGMTFLQRLDMSGTGDRLRLAPRAGLRRPGN